MTLVGAKLDGDTILVFQESRELLPDRISVRNDVLRDVIAAQVNRVNLFRDDGLRSLVFQGGDAWKLLD